MSGRKKADASESASALPGTAPAVYRVLRGISWPDGKSGWVNVQAGELRQDLPTEYVAEWIGIGAIEPLDTSGEPAAEEG